MSRRRRRRSLPIRGTLAAIAVVLLAWLVPLGWRRLPAPLSETLVYVLAVWACAAVLTFLAFLAVSVDELSQVIRAAISGSTPAVWFAPALLLLASADAAVQGAALLMTAAATCLLTGQRAPRRRVLRPPPAAPPPPQMALFRDAGLQQGLLAGTLLPVILGALALQAGLWCWFAGYRLAAAALLALAAGLWTRSWVARSTAREARGMRSRAWSLAAVALVLVLSLGWSLRSLPAQPAADFDEEPESLLQDSRRILDRLSRPAPHSSASLPDRAMPLVGPRQGSVGRGGIPGMILRPNGKPRVRQLRIGPPVPGRLVEMSDPLTFPFTGEYHIFRSTSGVIPEGAPVEQGTPLEAVYITTNGGSMETQAYQPLIPPVDFARCGQVRLTLRSGEVFPAGASLELLTGNGLENLGTEVFGIESTAEETLNYRVPAVLHRLPVKALRVVFHHNPSQGAQSTRVAIVRFTLVPRSY